MPDDVAKVPLAPAVLIHPAGKEKTAKPKSKSHAGIADRDTPLIKNCWYVLDWSADIKNELKNRMVLGQDLVYFRAKSGDVTALQNRCAHRCFPLHRSTLHDNDTIQCGYHGLTYDTEGKCVKIPSAVNQSPGHISVQHYPVVDRSPMVWIWMGDPKKADVAAIPEYDWVNEDGWGYGDGYYNINANYLALHENLMDITHFEFLHGSALGTPGQTEADVDVTVRGNTVDNYRISHGEPVPGLHKKATGLGDAVITREAHSTFVTPGFHDGYGRFVDANGTLDGRTDYHPHILHFLTPEDQYSIHYHWIFGRDFSAPDAKWDKIYKDGTGKIFEEDRDAIEWIEQQWANDERPEFREAHVPADRGAVEMRRIVKGMAEAEAADK